MDFFDIGAGELLLILIIAFVVMGPAKIVKVSRDLGKLVYSLRKATTDLTSQVTREIEAEEKKSARKTAAIPPSGQQGSEQPGSSKK